MGNKPVGPGKKYTGGHIGILHGCHLSLGIAYQKNGGLQWISFGWCSSYMDEGFESLSLPIKKTIHLDGILHTLMRDSIANLPLANCMVLTSFWTGQSNSPPDCLDLDGFKSQSLPIRKPHPMVWFSYWQRMRDSNPRKRSQSPVCYRYTNPLGGDYGTRTCDLMRVKHAL